MLYKFRRGRECEAVLRNNSLEKSAVFPNGSLCYFGEFQLCWKVFHMTLLEFLFIRSWKDENNFLQYSRCHLDYQVNHYVVFHWQETVLLYVCRSNWLMGGWGSAELTIKGPAVIQSPITSRSTSNPPTTWLQRHISVHFLTGMYQLDRLASQKVFHQGPHILCNHRQRDTQRHTRSLLWVEVQPRKPLNDFIKSAPQYLHYNLIWLILFKIQFILLF